MYVRFGVLIFVLTGVCALGQTTVHKYVTIPANSNIYYGDTTEMCYGDRGGIPVTSPLNRDVTFDIMIYEQITVERDESYHCTRNDKIVNNVTGTGVEFKYLDQRDHRFHTLQFFVFLNEQDFDTYLRSSITPAS